MHTKYGDTGSRGAYEKPLEEKRRKYIIVISESMNFMLWRPKMTWHCPRWLSQARKSKVMIANARTMVERLWPDAFSSSNAAAATLVLLESGGFSHSIPQHITAQHGKLKLGVQDNAWSRWRSSVTCCAVLHFLVLCCAALCERSSGSSLCPN